MQTERQRESLHDRTVKRNLMFLTRADYSYGILLSRCRWWWRWCREREREMMNE